MKTAILAALGLLSLLVAAPAAAAQDAPSRADATLPASAGWLGIGQSYVTTGAGRSAREVSVVQRVHPASPAARAGIQPGDTIVRVNGRADVAARMRALQLRPGDSVRLRIRRGGERDRDLTLTAAERPLQAVHANRLPRRVEISSLPRGRDRFLVVDGDTIRIPVDSLVHEMDGLQRRLRVLLADSLAPRLREFERDGVPRLRDSLDSLLVRPFPGGLVLEMGGRGVLGAEVSELNPELAAYFEGAPEGVLVLRVFPGTPAERAGLQPGDVVTRVNGETVRNVAELRRATGLARGDEARLEVVRKGRRVQLSAR